MLDNLVFSLNAVLPIFLVMVLGFFIKKWGFFNNTGAKQMNAILFNFALPIKLFMDISASDLKEMMDLQLIVFSVAATISWFFITWGIAALFVKERSMKGAFVQGSFRSNYAIIGLPLIANIMGFLPSKGAVITTFVVPLYNILSVLILTIYGKEKLDLKHTITSSLKNIVKNPLIIGIVLGVLFSASKIPMPKAIGSTLGYMSDLSTPIALLCIGASMDFSQVKKCLRPALAVCFLKLIAMPVLFLGIAFLMHMPSDSIVVLFVMLAAPTAISSYVMAMYMGSDEHLASNIVLLTSLLSVFTYTLGVYFLKQTGII